MAPSTSSSSTSSSADTTKACMTSAQATLLILTRFTAALSSDSPPPPNVPFPPLSLLAQSATLIKAHTTKLSLLLLNKPFTPSAVKKVIDAMSNEALTGLASGAQLVHPRAFGHVMHEEVKICVRRVYRELEGLMQEVLVRLETMEKEEKSTDNRDTLASTGVLWDACDAVIALEKLGLAGVVVRKAKEYREMLEDAIGELKEWGEREAFEDEEDEERDGEGDVGSEDEEEYEIAKILGGADGIPKSRLDLRETLEGAVRKLRLTSTLFQAVSKRRLKTIPATGNTNVVAGVDQLMEKLKSIPEETDELASAFYSLDNDESKRLIGEVLKLAQDTAKLVQKNWQGEEDEFTVWSGKWKEAVEKS